MTEIEPESQTADELPETVETELDSEPEFENESELVLESESEEVDPTDAFSVLGNEVRMAALRALLDAETDGEDTLAFSDLFDASPADNTAGFSYHLRQLAEHFVRKTDGGYTLTYAGREIARAIRAGTYTDSVDFDPIRIGDPCPFCGKEELEAHGEDNYVVVECRACERPTLTLPFPPGGHRGFAETSQDRGEIAEQRSAVSRTSSGETASYRAHDPDGLLTAFDRHHRHRLSLMADGVCPECSAPANAHVEYHDAENDETENRRPQVQFDCERCGCRLRSPVTLAVLEHPAVISFYHRHGIDIRERPVWNVGEEWREAVVSEDPWCVRVSTAVDGDVLSLFVASNLEVVTVRETGQTAS
ncbi:helix-turn-helix domain-containing protein [Haladaptatus sp. AB643]|uniref:helix-turn-helix domain-containing protein n=1 Tax=Haladaptatus sp. AB643 TaxID=2934174 RepID=UPI00209C4B5D|nr:helix-turn-helix domain-containing protein [Haladaptatus sp. AB643]MCO8245008.1 helix-turn-helix domain-containing protein [Haladaptatus sp. AB643]